MAAFSALAMIITCLGGCGDSNDGSGAYLDEPFFVTATVETDSIPNGGDAADDLCIWIHPTDLSKSLIVGTDKRGGIGVYDLSGREIQYRADGKMNNVDIRYNFPLGGDDVALVTATNLGEDTIAIYTINTATGELEPVAVGVIDTGISVYGLCMYHSPISGKYYSFVTSTNGTVQQWELFDNGSGLVDASLERTFDVGSGAEGCVADDEAALLYVGEENDAIWRYGAEPGDGEERLLVDRTGNHFMSDVEGLTIYYAGKAGGYLIASSQGNSTFVIYERDGTNEYVTTFAIEAENDIDAVSTTDGIDVVNIFLNDDFPEGVFVAQDNNNSKGEHQNFKLVPWESIANSANPPLVIDLSWDPRLVGS
ncbi:MAG: phytase [Deltaproteobacteria bacterium]|nr:phytase [Deltaproteobacteria bacterium]